MALLSMSSRDRRTLALGVASMSTILLVGRGIPALRRWQAAVEASAFESAEQLASLGRDARLRPLLRRGVDVRRSRLAALDSTVLHAASPAAAGEELSGIVGDIADDAGVQIASISVHADSAFRSDFARTAVRLGGTTDVTGLATMLREIEAGDHLLAVRQLSVQQPDPAAPDAKPEALQVELVIEALVRRVRPAGGGRS